MKHYLAAILLSVVSSTTFGKIKINFPEEELATESVLPKFEEKSAIKNRKVKHAERFEINLMGGMVASEAIYSPFHFGGSLAYHFDNTHGIHIMATFFSGGLNDNGEALKKGKVFLTDGSSGEIRFDAEKAPNKELLSAVHYQYTAYYGKISLMSDVVMNLTLSALLGGGAYIMGDVIAPAANVGISQRFYLNSTFALRFDIIFSAFNGVDITSAGSLNPTDGVVPDVKDFDRFIQFDSNLFFGLSFLL